MPGSFSISLSPASGGGNRSYSVSVTSIDGFSGRVNLASSMSPTALCDVSPPSVTISAGGFATAACSVGNVIQASTLTVTGTSDDLTQSTQANVAAGSFNVSVGPTAGTGNSNYSVTVTSVNNFAGMVNLTSALNPVANCNVTPPTVNVPAGGSATATCAVGNVIQASVLTVTGSFTQGITITASDTSDISAGSFSMSVTPTSGNGNSNYAVLIASVNQFAGAVNLACVVNPAANCTISPAFVTLTAGGQAQPASCMVGNVIQASTLTVSGSYTQGGVTIPGNATANIAPGSFNINVTSPNGRSPFTVTVASVKNFAGSVNLSSFMSNGGMSNVMPTPVPVPAGSSGSATCMTGLGPATLMVNGSYTQGTTITASGAANVTA